MKCISLWQPWAELVVIGAKEFETRSWPTVVRGRVAIHAAKKWNAELRELADDFTVRAPGSFYPTSMCFGAIVGTVELTDCRKVLVSDVHPFDPLSAPNYIPSDEWKVELAFGNYNLIDGPRYAWRLADPVKLDEPIPYKGAQGFFEVPDELLREGTKQ